MTIKKDRQKCVTPVLALCWGGKFLKMAFFPSTNTLQRGSWLLQEYTTEKRYVLVLETWWSSSQICFSFTAPVQS